MTEGAKALGVSRSALSHLVNESSDLSWDMAIRLAKAFGGTPEGWILLQFQHDAAQVEERSKKIKVKTFTDMVSIGRRRCASNLKGPSVDHGALLYDERDIPQ